MLKPLSSETWAIFTIVTLQMTIAAFLGRLVGWYVVGVSVFLFIVCFVMHEITIKQEKKWIKKGRREWVKIAKQPDCPQGWIPRDVLENLGVDCTPLDRCIAPGYEICWKKGQDCNDPTHHQGVVWIRNDIAEKVHSHAEFEPTDK